MVNFPSDKLYNSYLIETTNFESTIRSIYDFAIELGFDDKLVNSNNHPDIYILKSIDEKMKISIVRDEIINTSYYMPSVSKKKFYIIYDAINLDANIQNAMLKTLEESPEFDMFFLITSNEKIILETIKSRCMRLKDNEKDTYHSILDSDYLDEAIFLLSNIKYMKIMDLLPFCEKFKKRDGEIKRFIKINRYILRDVFVYKKTLSKELIVVKEKINEIINISNALSYNEIGKLIDNLNYLSKIKNYEINRKIAIFNFYNIENY